MDSNGTKFHLVFEQRDWAAWHSVDQDVALRDIFERPQDFVDAEIEWNAREANLRLARQVSSFRSATAQPPTSLENRRGAARDRYGHWYWINDARDAILFCAREENSPVVFWNSRSGEDCDIPNPDKSQFQPQQMAETEPLSLSGLAITDGHYLVVGVVAQGILIFDLHRGGPPTLLVWMLPDERPFLPWDMAATSGGGLLILDRENRRYWELNRHFQLATVLPAADETAPQTTFQPKDRANDEEPRRVKQPVPHIGYALEGTDDLPPPMDPISIDHGPNNRVLILDAPADSPSQVYVYEHDQLINLLELSYPVPDEDDSSRSQSLSAHDFAYLNLSIDDASTQPVMPLQAAESAPDGSVLHLLFVARRDGNQVIVYLLDPGDPAAIDVQPDYLPLRRWREKALVVAGSQLFYDFGACWIPVGVFFDCVYATAAVIQSPIDFERRYISGQEETAYTVINGVPEQPFDSNILGCVWHRLLLDAEIPAGTQIVIHARAADDHALLASVPWVEQPKPYQRSGGAELPYYDPYTNRREEVTLTEKAGTWEILCQNVVGRYAQIQLTLQGTGRTTPEIQGLRLWYPRFSYQSNYLPAIYGEDLVSASLTERLLANYEGFYTNLEDKIVQLSSLLDPRTTPPDALEWLAKWLGVVLHPLWDEERRRFFIRFAHRLYTMRGTVPGIIIGLRLFLDEEIDEWIFDPACADGSRVRIVEHFLTRNVAGNVFGDTDGVSASGGSVATAAHRFTVLIPHRFEDGRANGSETIRMVERILELEKPAHTWFEIKEYWNMFRVGEARLGIDSQIGYSATFQPLVLGDSILPDTYLGYPYPYNIQDRFVMERNKVNQ